MEQLAKLRVPNVQQAASQLFPLLGLITLIRQTMPPEGHEALRSLGGFMRSLLSPFCFVTVNEFEGNLPNDFYNDVHLHLESFKAYNKAKNVAVFRQPKSLTITMRLSSSNDVIVDKYKGMTVWWMHFTNRKEKTYRNTTTTTKEYQLKIRKRDKAKLLPEYLEFITQSAAMHSGKTREIKIYTNGKDGFHQYTSSGSRRLWEEVMYKHPSTFDTLALDPFLKAKIIADLTSFSKDKLFYAKAGRAWKRGYLLYGPPGTGKSSMIAAMANFLKYDIYDLELSLVRTNGDLRQLLLQTTARSIIVLEDIDCSVKFTKTRSYRGAGKSVMLYEPGEHVEDDDPNRVTLSGLLNFVDGLWSVCGDERIIVFTTNHIEALDKALLRPGRMDMQIELSYCTFPAFRVLARNYLSVEEHPSFEKLETAFVGKTLTPAYVAELLIKDKNDVDTALASVLSALETNALEAQAPTPEPAVDIEVSAASSRDLEASAASSRDVEVSAASSSRDVEVSGASSRDFEVFAANSRDVEVSGAGSSRDFEVFAANSRGVEVSGASSRDVEVSEASSRDFEVSGASSRDVEVSAANSRNVEVSGASSRGAEASGASSRDVEVSGASSRGAEASAASSWKDEASGGTKKVCNDDVMAMLDVIDMLMENEAQPPAATTSDVEDLVPSIQSAFLKNACEGTLDSAIEGVIQNLATKLSKAEIAQVFNVLPTNNGTPCRKLFDVGSSSKAPVSNGLHKDTENGEMYS